jgi:hypothetical protein
MLKFILLIKYISIYLSFININMYKQAFLKNKYYVKMAIFVR